LPSTAICGAFLTLAIWNRGACRGAQQPAPPEPLPRWAQPAEPTDQPLRDAILVSAQLLASTPNSLKLQEHSGRAVVRDAVTWRRIWEEAQSGTSPVPPLPEVDFDRHVVLAVASGFVRHLDRVAVDTVATTSRGLVAVVAIERHCGPVDDLCPQLFCCGPRELRM
jgi:hypothetical protein